VKYPLFLSYFEFSGQTFEKYSNTKSKQNPPSVRLVVPCGQTDRHDETNSCFFCEFANSPENKVGTAENTEMEDITRVFDMKGFEIFTFHDVLEKKHAGLVTLHLLEILTKLEQNRGICGVPEGPQLLAHKPNPANKAGP